MMSKLTPVRDQLVSFDGLRLAFYEWGAPSDEPPVVLQHGFMADARLNWEASGVVASLVHAGRHVFALDARGHGQSDKPHNSSVYGEPNMARDVTRLLDLIGVPTFDLVGYSMGAVIALLVASSDRRIRRLVVGGVGCAVVELGGVDTRVLNPASLVSALEAEQPELITDPAALEFRRFADAVKADRRALAAHARVVHASPIALDAIIAKTLVLVGRDDELGKRPEQLANSLPHGELQYVRGDHMNALLDPLFARTLTSFLSRDTATTAASLVSMRPA